MGKIYKMFVTFVVVTLEVGVAVPIRNHQPSEQTAADGSIEFTDALLNSTLDPSASPVRKVLEGHIVAADGSIEISDALPNTSHYPPGSLVRKALKGYMVAADGSIKITDDLPNSTHYPSASLLHKRQSQVNDNIEALEAACIDETTRRRSGRTCSFYTSGSWCDVALNSRRRSFGGEAKDSCVKTCGLSPCSENAFAMLFISDMETEYRGHKTRWCKKIVEYAANHGSVTFDGDYADVSRSVSLVVHGGDISDYTYGTWKKKGEKAASHLMSEVWSPLYNAGKPTISLMGNHDANEGNINADHNSQVNAFVRSSFSKTKDIMGNDFTYTEINNSNPKGQSLFKAEFKGLQIGVFNDKAFLNDASGSQFNDLSTQLDRDKPTVFFSHHPLASMSNDTQETMVKELVWQFPRGTAMFSGHAHFKFNRRQTNRRRQPHRRRSFVDYTAPYPHPWEKSHRESGKSGEYDPAGMYAVLVSPTAGVLQVKEIEIPYQSVTGCWGDGTVCGQGTTCSNCCHTARDALRTKCGGAKWSDGTICGEGTTCKACENDASYWYSKAFTACGDEPCWGKGTICGYGTTCNACCHGQKCPWYWFGVCECK